MNAPIACFSAPNTTQPGPAMIIDVHHARRFSAVRGGMNRR